MTKTIQILWKLFLLSFPFSIHFVLYEKASYRFGNFSPWVTGFLYLPEILLALVCVLWFIQKTKNKEPITLKTSGAGLTLLFLFLLNAGIVTYFYGDIVLYLFFLIRVLEAGIIYLLIRQKIIPHEAFISWLLYGAVLQIMIAYIQTRLNHSVGLTLMGEPVIGPDIANVAKTDLADGSKIIRPYGTFLHPNLLGAYLLTIFFISLPHLKKAALPVWIILLCVGIYLTGSQAAQLTLLLTAGILLMLSFMRKALQKKYFCWGFLGIIAFANLWIYENSAQLAWNYNSIAERLMQNVISMNMFLGQWWGVGVANFTLVMEQFSHIKLLPWEFQPVHNTYFLILNETGIQGLLLLVAIIGYKLHDYWQADLQYLLKDKARILPLFALIIIASFDHLLWTSWLGPILIGMVVAETTRPR
ncbi:O-antigen ligase family protein [Candidatus Peregrinibacteria bacterium]|nr:O-antigen ligase family protein [Candidatus Peregrinibacteria bacterium]